MTTGVTVVVLVEEVYYLESTCYVVVLVMAHSYPILLSPGTSMPIRIQATFQRKQIRDAVVAVVNVRAKLYLRRHIV